MASAITAGFQTAYIYRPPLVPGYVSQTQVYIPDQGIAFAKGRVFRDLGVLGGALYHPSASKDFHAFNLPDEVMASVQQVLALQQTIHILWNTLFNQALLSAAAGTEEPSKANEEICYLYKAFDKIYIKHLTRRSLSFIFQRKVSL